jgi:hypothetical protein
MPCSASFTEESHLILQKLAVTSIVKSWGKEVSVRDGRVYILFFAGFLGRELR